MTQIAQNLEKRFKKHRIVFWYDSKKELRKDYDELEFSDIEKIELNNNEFRVKHRIHFYLPGWEVDIIRGEMFSDGYGFVVDYLAEILRSLRNHDYSDHYSQYYNLVSDISTRDKDGINKTFSGMMKILFPHKEATEKEIEEVLQFAIEGRKRVKDQLMKIDSTYCPGIRL